jgi:hypothetical protein
VGIILTQYEPFPRQDFDVRGVLQVNIGEIVDHYNLNCLCITYINRDMFHVYLADFDNPV